MRYGWPLVLLGVLWVLGCAEPPSPGPPTPPISLLTFHYDAARDVVLAHTVSLPTTVPLTAQRYADLLATRADVRYAPAPGLRLSDPVPHVTDGAMTVDYHDVAGLAQFNAVQTEAVLAALEAWCWVPGVGTVSITANGAPLTALGSLVLTDPLTPRYHTYVVQTDTGEVGYLPGSPTPADLDDGLDILRRRDAFTAPAGFQPLLPAGVKLTADPARMTDDFLDVDLQGLLPGTEHLRLAGMILMLTQFPKPHAVRFTFGGVVSSEPFMRTTLDDILTPYALLLPEPTGSLADAETQAALRTAITARLGHTPAYVGPARVWRDWAVLPVKLTPDGVTLLYVLQLRDGGYTVVQGGPNLPVGDLLARQVPRDAIVALRLPGWEQMGLMTMEVAGATPAPPASFHTSTERTTEQP